MALFSSYEPGRFAPFTDFEIPPSIFDVFSALFAQNCASHSRTFGLSLNYCRFTDGLSHHIHIFLLSSAKRKVSCRTAPPRPSCWHFGVNICSPGSAGPESVNLPPNHSRGRAWRNFGDRSALREDAEPEGVTPAPEAVNPHLPSSHPHIARESVS